MKNLNLRPILNKVGTKLNQSSPTLLAIAAVGGVVYVGYQSAVDTSKAMKLLKEAEKDGPLSKLEKIKLCWKCYIPTAVTSAGTIALMICSNRASAKRIGALAAACTLSEKAFKDYKEEIKKVVDEKDLERVRDALDKKHVNEAPTIDESIQDNDVIPNRKILCYEAYCGSYFYSNMETIQQIMNRLNLRIIADGYISYNEVLSELGVQCNNAGDYVGFNTDNPIDIAFTSQLTENGKPVLVVDYEEDPIADFRRW